MSSCALRNAAYHFVFTRQSRGKLDALTTLVERGLVKPVIGATLPLARMGEAHELLENRRSYALRGKVAIDVGRNCLAAPAHLVAEHPRKARGPVALEVLSHTQCLQFVYTDFMAAETTTVRVRRHDSERLQSLAKARQTAVVDVVHAAIDALERQEFLRGLNGDYQRLRNDPELWEQYLAERREWDALA